MPRHWQRILAIDPGTREMGFAVLEGGALLYHGVEVFKGIRRRRKTLNEGRSKILRLVRDFRPQIVAVEGTSFVWCPNATIINAFTADIVAVARRQRLSVAHFAPSTVKKV